MAFVVANLTDNQLEQLDQRGIPYLRIEDRLVPRFRALLPPGMTPEQALDKLVRQAIFNGEQQVYENAEGQSLDARKRAHRADLAGDLGL